MSRSGLDLVSLWREVTPLLADLAPHFETPCFFTVDPESLLITSHFQEGLPEIPGEWLGREYQLGDYNSMSEVLSSKAGIGTLHDATDGHPELSRKFAEEMQPYGCEQELLLALRTRDGESWGSLGLYRESGAVRFSAAEAAALRSVAAPLAQGARFALLLGSAYDPDLRQPPGHLIFDRHLNVASATPSADYWLGELGGSTQTPPGALLACVGQALSDRGGPSVARVLSTTSRWIVVHTARLGTGGDHSHVSAVIQGGQPNYLAPLLLRAYGLSKREQEVTSYVLRGGSTAAIAKQMAITENTVQQHLKRVFDKTGVRSRRELVSTMFLTNYEPRVRDNEARTINEQPSRHGPRLSSP